MVIIGIVIICILIGVIVYKDNENKKLRSECTKIIPINVHNKEINDTLLNEKYALISDIEKITRQKKDLRNECDRLSDYNTSLHEKIASQNKEYDNLKSVCKDFIETRNKISRSAFENYQSILNAEYDKATKEHDMLINNLDKAYENRLKYDQDNYDKQKNSINKDIENMKNELAALKETKENVIKAALREEEIKNKLSFYCLQLSDTDKNDIVVLDSIRNKLNKPRLLSMLIWSTYFQKQMTQLCNNILGTENVIGIYKITNQIDNRCYIGQSRNVSDRWKQHCKAGLGIDTPQGNKLYQAMTKDGVQNFSWELLESCTAEELNDKERYYIDLYMAKDFGYNTLKGVGK